MAFNRQLYKQKPQAWGPVSAVQASIFKNAERAGIDPASIALAMPMWNLFDYSKNNHVLSNIGVDFVNNSALFLAGNYLYFSSDKIKGNIGTVFLHCESVGAPDLYGVVLFGTNTTTPVWQQINLETNNKDVVFGRELNAYTKVLGTFFNSKNKSVIFWSDGSIGGLKLLINNIQISTAPAQAGVSYAAGSKTFRIGNWAGGINWDFSGIMGCFFYFDTALKYSQITYLSDNPYFLLYRVAPVFYSVPGGGVLPTFNPLFLNAAQPTRVIQ